MDRKALLPILFLALLILAAAPTGEPIKIALVGPMSGDLARMGRYMREGAELAVSEWNEKGGIFGRKVELLIGDDQADPKQAILVAKRMVREGVFGIVGHFTSSASIPASRIYYEAGIPQITPASTDPRLTEQGFDNVFRTCGRDDQQGRVAAEFVLKHLKARRIAAVHDKTPYGYGLAEAFRKAVEGKGRRLLAYEAIMQGERDFAALVERLKPLRLDVLYFGGFSREAGLLLKQMRERGLEAAFVSGDGVIGEEFVRVAGEKAALGSFLTSYPDPKFLPSATAVIARYEKRYGPIGPYSLYTFDATSALLHAIEQAKPKDGSKQELRKVVKALRAMTYAGALGSLRWDKKGDVVGAPYVVYVTREGGNYQGWFAQITGIPKTAGRREE